MKDELSMLTIDDLNVEAATVAREGVAARRYYAWELRRKGKNYHEIAKIIRDEFGENNLPATWDHAFAARDVSMLMRQHQNEIRESAPEMAWIELDRLDDLLAAVWPDAMAGDSRAIASALSISDRRRKIVGLDQDTLTPDWKVELGALLASGTLRPEQVSAEFGEDVLAQILATKNEK